MMGRFSARLARTETAPPPPPPPVLAADGPVSAGPDAVPPPPVLPPPAAPAPPPASVNGPAEPPPHAAQARLLEAKVRLHKRLIEELNLPALEKLPEHELRREIHGIVSGWVVAERLPLNARELEIFVGEVLD